MEKLARLSIRNIGMVICIGIVILLNLLNLNTFVSFREYYAFIFMPGAVFIMLLVYNYITYNISKQSMNGNTQQEILRDRDRTKKKCIRFARGLISYGFAILLWYIMAIIGYLISNLPQF